MVASNILGLKLKPSLCTEVAASQESAQFLCGFGSEIVSVGDTGKMRDMDFVCTSVRGQLLGKRPRQQGRKSGIDVTLEHLPSVPTSTSALSSFISTQLLQKRKKNLQLHSGAIRRQRVSFIWKTKKTKIASGLDAHVVIKG